MQKDKDSLLSSNTYNIRAPSQGLEPQSAHPECAVLPIRRTGYEAIVAEKGLEPLRPMDNGF